MAPKPKKSETSNTVQRRFPCDFCTKSFNWNAELIRHTRMHTGEKPYKCRQPGCNKAFTLKSALKSHSTYVHSKVTEKAFKCELPECGKAFAHETYLTSHLKSHDYSTVPCPVCNREVRKVRLTSHVRRHTKSKTFACTVCEVKVSSAAVLKRHMTMLHSTDWKTFDCPYCDKRCNQLRHFNAHLRTHTGETPFPCAKCDKKYKSDGALLLHVRSAHSGEAKDFACDQCPKRFFFKAKLTRHKTTVHSDIGKKHVCPVCEKKFNEKGQLGNHMNMHTGEKPFSCTDCQKSFTTFGSRSSHIRKWHSGIPRPNYPCSFCDKIFQEKNYWKIHEETHSVPSVTCEQCGKEYTNRMMLQAHVRRHHRAREYPFQCSFCNLRFTTKNAMDVHIRRHIGEKPNACTFSGCQMRFLHKYELKQHLQTHSKTTARKMRTNPRYRRKSYVQFQELENTNDD